MSEKPDLFRRWDDLRMRVERDEPCRSDREAYYAEERAICLLADEIAKEERDACAKLCEAIAEDEEDNGRGDAVPLACSKAIRARKP